MSFKNLNARNKAEIKYLQQKIRNNTKLGKLLSGQIKWTNLGPANYRHMRYVESQPRMNNAATNKRLGELVNSITSRRVMYGYLTVRNAHRNAPWVQRTFMRNGILVKNSAPVSIPNWEVSQFRQPGRHGMPWQTGLVVQAYSKEGRAITNNQRAKLVAEGSLRPLVYGPNRKPSPPRPKFVYKPPGPSLQKLAWNASGMEALTPAQRTGVLRAMGYKYANFKNIRPKSPLRLSPTTLTKLRRNAAAKTIQHAVRRHQRQVAR
jgi:hypothetical protein